MTELNQIYKCNVCGNIVEVLHAGAGELVCCGEPMEPKTANTVDASKEKHVPVIEEAAGGVKVKVGSEPHPMIPEHFIEWIEIITRDGRVCRRALGPGEEPEAEFYARPEEVEMAREYCNIHGLWRRTE